MGVLNVTPDSFSDGGRYASVAEAVDHGLVMVEQGAGIIDVGGESTRPGAKPVPAAEELERVLAVVEGLVAGGARVSIDTRKAGVAAAAVASGAEVVNDVGGLTDPDMMAAVADSQAGVVIMHMQGEPPTMQDDPVYEDVVEEVKAFLLAQAAAAESAGIARDRIVIDPGIGFGKTLQHNLALLRNISSLVESPYPVLLGTSRKGFLGKILGDAGSPAGRDPATAATVAWALREGVGVVRVHNVAMMAQVVRTIEAIEESG